MSGFNLMTKDDLANPRQYYGLPDNITDVRSANAWLKRAGADGHYKVASQNNGRSYMIKSYSRGMSRQQWHVVYSSPCFEEVIAALHNSIGIGYC